jgi:hypothetical protein
VVKSLPLTANGMINGTLIKFFYSVETSFFSWYSYQFNQAGI